MQPGSHLSIGRPATNSYDMFLQWIIASKPILAMRMIQLFDGLTILESYIWLNVGIYSIHEANARWVSCFFVPIFVLFWKFRSIPPPTVEVYMSVLDRRSTALFRQLSTMVGMVKDRVETPQLLWVKWGCCFRLKPSWTSCLFYGGLKSWIPKETCVIVIVTYYDFIVSLSPEQWKKPGRLGYLGGILPFLMGFIISHCRNPYSTASINGT